MAPMSLRSSVSAAAAAAPATPPRDLRTVLAVERGVGTGTRAKAAQRKQVLNTALQYVTNIQPTVLARAQGTVAIWEKSRAETTLYNLTNSLNDVITNTERLVQNRWITRDEALALAPVYHSLERALGYAAEHKLAMIIDGYEKQIKSF